MVAGGAMAIAGQSHVDKLDDLHGQVWASGGLGCESAACADDFARANREHDSAVTLRNAGIVVLGVGTVAVAGGVVWYLLGSRHGDTASSRPTIALAPGVGWLQLSGVF